MQQRAGVQVVNGQPAIRQAAAPVAAAVTYARQPGMSAENKAINEKIETLMDRRLFYELLEPVFERVAGGPKERMGYAKTCQFCQEAAKTALGLNRLPAGLSITKQEC